MSEPRPIFAAENLTLERKRGDRPAIAELTLGARRGDVLAVLGREGSGRDILLAALLGELPGRATKAGSLTLGDGGDDGPRLTYLPGPESRVLAPFVSTLAQLTRIVARTLSLSRKEAREKLHGALEHLPHTPDFLARLSRPPRRVACRERAFALLVTALAQDPDAILADDALAGLEPSESEEMASLLLKEQSRRGFALVYFTGDPVVATRLGGRIAILREGKLTDHGTIEQLQSTKSHSYTHVLLRAAPRLGQRPRDARRKPRAEPLLQVRSFAFEKADDPRRGAAEGITFDLRRGASLALIGEHGSGRRALIRAVIGLEPAPQGRIIFDSVDIGILSRAMLARLRKRVGFVTGDDRALDPRMTVGGTIEEPMRAHMRLPAEERKSAASAVLKRVGLGDMIARQKAGALSALDRRRLQIARVIAANPQLVVLFEPLEGLDALGQALILDLLCEMREREGPALLVVTANFAIAEALADDALILKAGRIVARGTIAELVRAPQDAYVRRLVAAVSAAPADGLSQAAAQV